MIKSLSPYWLSIPLVSSNTSLTCTDFTLEVFVWNGDKGNPPTTPSYEATIKNPTASTGNKRVDIANLISDFVDFTQQEGTGTELINGNNQNWVKWRTYYTTTDETDATTPSNQNTELMTRGYAYGMDGENTSTPSNKILLSGNEFKVSRNSVFVLPIEIDETVVVVGTLLITDIVTLGGGYYDIEFLETGNLDEVYFRWAIPDGDWIYGAETTNESPLNFLLNPPAGDYTFQIYAYDNVNAVTVYSNIFTKTIT